MSVAHHATRPAIGALTALVLAAMSATSAAQAPTLRRANTTAEGAEVPGTAAGVSLSADGRYAAFASNGVLIPPSNANGWTDVFVKDLRTGAIVRASADAQGTEGDGTSGSASISADGRRVAFDSIATNLAPGDANGQGDVFVKDLRTGAVVLASVTADGVQGNAVSRAAALSANGRVVAFLSYASNLVPDDTDNVFDLFAKDLVTGALTLVSRRSDDGRPAGADGRPAISADGRYVAFSSFAGLVADDTNGRADVYLADLATGTLRRVSVDARGAEADGDSRAPALSASGRHVAFQSTATNLDPDAPPNRQVDVFVKDMRTGAVRVASLGIDGRSDGRAIEPALSADGRIVAYESASTHLVAGDDNGRPDVFVTDLTTGRTVQLSRAPSGEGGNHASSHAAISANGRVVGFESLARNLVPDDGNGALDVFVGRTGRSAAGPRSALGRR